MVGYPSLSNRNRTAALNNLTFGTEVDAIWTFDAETQTWEEIKAGDYFEVGRGYWVHATQECVWEVGI
jgi:N6-adenosine-specific RNA methylase IME4